MKQKVVVIGHGYTSRLGVIRALGREGYEVIVVAITVYKRDGKTLNKNKPIDCYSKYVSRVLYCSSESEELVQLLLSECVDTQQKVVIIPDSDFSAAAIDTNQERLKDYFLFPHINHQVGAVEKWMDKVKQKQTAKIIGLEVADAWVITVKNGEYDIPNSIRFPCFPKPVLSYVGGKIGLRKCSDEQQLRQAISQLIRQTPNIIVLVEEYKQIDKEFALMGFTDGVNVIIPGIIQTTLLASGGHFGVAEQGLITPITGFEELVEMFREYVLQTKFVGIFDIDFFKSNGKYYFCEMNFRYGGSGYAYTAMGVNLPKMLVRSLIGESIENMQQIITKQAVFVNERMCKDDWAANYISTRKLIHFLRHTDISFVVDEEDKEPQKQFYKSLFDIKLNIKRIAKRLLRKR